MDEVLEKEGSPTPSQPVVEMAQVEDTDSYLDIDTVQLLDEDFQIITNIRKLSDTTRDKLVFTIFTVNIMLTGFMVGYIPQYYYIAYTFKAVLLIGYRWYFYKKINFHYFLLDFCYFTTFLILVYLWLPCCDTFRGALYPIIFGFSNGPLLAAVALWRNSIVPHSLDKMTSVFIHISPAVTLWGIRWYTLEEQRFPLCANPTVPGPDGCNHVDSGELLFYPMFMYLIWQMVYAIVVYFWRKERVERKNCETSYKLLVEKSRNSTLYQWCSVFGIKYGKLLFAAYQFVYTIVSMLLAYPCFHYIYTNTILVVIVLVVASYNGASFYIDVFSQRYRNNKDK